MNAEATSTAILKASQTATYGGGGVAVYFGLTANEIAAFGGVVIGLIGLVTNLVFKWLHYRLARDQGVKAGLSD